MEKRKEQKESNGKTTYKVEKLSLKEYFRIYRGLKMPWVMLAIGFVGVIASAFISSQTADLTGDILDASGKVPTARLVAYTVATASSLILSAMAAVMNGISSEHINLGMRKKLWHKIINAKQSCYDADSGESLVSRVTTDCDFSGVLFTTVSALVSSLISIVIYFSQMYRLNGRMTAWGF